VVGGAEDVVHCFGLSLLRGSTAQSEGGC
jgi:hypothetical protein